MVFSRVFDPRQLSGPALPGRTFTGCVILRNSHVIRVAAQRVRLIREIPAKGSPTSEVERHDHVRQRNHLCHQVAVTRARFKRGERAG